jgi:hypothetical protein
MRDLSLGHDQAIPAHLTERRDLDGPNLSSDRSSFSSGALFDLGQSFPKTYVVRPAALAPPPRAPARHPLLRSGGARQHPTSETTPKPGRLSPSA